MRSPGDLEGLSAADVAERQAGGATNAYRPSTGRSSADILRENLLTPFNITLVALLAALLALGQIGDTFLAAGAVAVNALAGLVQEFRAKRTMDRLARQAVGTVRVRREGGTVEIAPQDVVLDDVVDVRPGDRVGVDGPLLWADALEVDESLITGEPDLVAKGQGDALTSGSFVVAGRGLVSAAQIGADSFVNRLGATAAGYRRSLTPVQRSLNAIVEISVLLMAIFGPLVVIQGYVGGVTLPDMLRNAVVIVTTFVPQGLVLATTLALSYGAIRIGMQRTLVQRINAVESMGNVTMLCFDKTGTLTENELSVERIVGVNGVPEAGLRAELAAYIGCLAVENRTTTAIGDAVGRAQGGSSKVAETSFTSARKWGAVTYADGRTVVLGAPEIIASEPAVREQASQAAEGGLRVVAFAATHEPGPDGQLPTGLRTSALVLLRDATRADVRPTLDALVERGISLCVISGDSLPTVLAVVREAGLEVAGTITGPELEGLDDVAFRAAVARCNVYARISPATKRRIVATLTARGEYVAMVGDGVNDVPALKEARLGIAMANGAQMAKDVSDLVLLDNALTTLPRALREGAITTQKVYASTRMLLAKNVYLILAVIFIGFMALPFPGQVRQLSWVTTVTTAIPALLVSLGYIRPTPVSDFRRQVIGSVIVSGLIGSLALAAAYAGAYFASGEDADVARTSLSLMVLAYGIIVMWDVHGVRPFEPRTFAAHPVEAVVGVALGVIGVVVPLAAPGFFRLEPMPPDVLAGLLVGIVVVALVYWRSTFAHPRILEPIRVLVHAGRV
ncbi:MAG: HAD-IC family P-type ATPase [Candidatus Limnocylindrales bacterium]